MSTRLLTRSPIRLFASLSHTLFAHSSASIDHHSCHLLVCILCVSLSLSIAMTACPILPISVRMDLCPSTAATLCVQPAPQLTSGIRVSTCFTVYISYDNACLPICIVARG